MTSASDAPGGAIAALIDRGEEAGCLALSEVDELVQALELEEADLGGLYEQLEARGVDLRDDCGRDTATSIPRLLRLHAGGRWKRNGNRTVKVVP